MRIFRSNILHLDHQSSSSSLGCIVFRLEKIFYRDERPCDSPARETKVTYYQQGEGRAPFRPRSHFSQSFSVAEGSGCLSETMEVLPGFDVPVWFILVTLLLILLYRSVGSV